MRVLAVSGSSGGHIFPAISFLDALKAKYRYADTLLVLPKKNIKDRIERYGHPVNYISVSNLKASVRFKNIISIFNFFKGYLESAFILSRFSPDIIVGFGSVASIPLVLLGWLFRIKTLIHEQNVIIGRANYLLLKFADRVALSFAATQDDLRANKKIAVTGNPLRREIAVIEKNTALSFLGLPSRKFTILVMGGSQGSHRLNAGFLKAVLALKNKESFQVIHLSGEADYAWLKAEYLKLGLTVSLSGFLKAMQYAYSAADLVIARSGATSIAEILRFRLPAILIPYPYAYRHQLANAQVLSDKGCALILEDEALDSDKLSQIIETLLDRPQQLQDMVLRYNQIPVSDAANLLVEEAVSLI